MRNWIKMKKGTALVTLLTVCFFGSLLGQKVELIEESTATNEGLYFWYPNGEKAFHYNPNISPRGDCMTVVNGYIYFGWYKGGMKDRDLMISRKKIGSGKWVTVQLPHKNTLIGAKKTWGDSHNTISVGVSKKDGTVHVFYDHHNDPLKYIISKKNVAFGPDSEFKLANFEKTRGYLAPGENIQITYPKITQNDRGDVLVNYRTGAAVGGNEIVHAYDGNGWSRGKQITDGRPGKLSDNPERIGWNYAYGTPYFNNGEVYYAFTVRWAEKKDQGILNEGLYLAKTGPTFTDEWEDLNGKKHKLPIVDFSPFLVANPPSHNGKGASGGAGIAVSENGGVHLTYYGRGPGTTHQYTYSRKAGEKKFTQHQGKMQTGFSWNNRFYEINASGSGKITISSGEPGTINYRTDLTLQTNKKFGVTSSYLNDGKLVLIASEEKQSDKKDIYCYVFQIGDGGDVVTPPSNQAPVVDISSPANNATFELGDVITLNAGASDPDGNLDKVNFFVNDAIILSDSDRPFETTFTPTAAGTYTLVARAIDKESAKTDATVTITVVEKNLAPRLSFANTTASSLVEGYEGYLITVEASDPNGDKFNVLLKINQKEVRSESVAPYEWGHVGSPNPSETVGLPVGNHLIEAIATDDKGLSTTISRTLTVTRRVITSTSGLDDQEELSVYPNPSPTGVFQLSRSTDWELYSLRGVKIQSGTGTEVDLSSDAQGVYLLKVNGKVFQLLNH